MFANEHMVHLANTVDKHIRTRGVVCDHHVHTVVDEKTDIPVGGIEFDIPDKFHSRASKSLLDSVRRLHFNSGHPPNAELERIVRLAGGSDVAQAAVRGIRCSICKKAAPPKPHKPGRVRDNIGQFNDTVLVDLSYVKDSDGVTHTWMIIIDDGTDWCVAKYVKDGKSAVKLYQCFEEAWIEWAGPPDKLVGDSERGFAALEFVEKLSRAGTLFSPAAAYAPWQKGKVERKVRSFKEATTKAVLQLGIKGPDEMRLAGIEVAAALNQRPGPSGISPGTMLFGQRMKLYAELYADGEPALHPLDNNNALARQLQIRSAAKQSH